MDQGLQTAHLASAWQDAFSLCEVHHAEAGDLLAPVSFLSLTVDLPLVPYIYMFTCRACPLTFWSCCSAGSAPDREKVEAACSQIGGKLVGRSARAPPWARVASASASCLETGAKAGQAKPAVPAAAMAAAEAPAASAGAAHVGVAAPCDPAQCQPEPQKHGDAWL